MSKVILESKEELKNIIQKCAEKSKMFSWKKDISDKYNVSGIKEFSGIFENTEFNMIDLNGVIFDVQGSLKNILKCTLPPKKTVINSVNLDVIKKFNDFELPNREYDLQEEFYHYLGVI